MEQVKCNLCSEDNTKHLWTIDGLSVVKCNNCKLIYVNPRLTEKELVKIYNEHYYTNPDFYSDEELKHFGYDDYFSDKDNIQLNFSGRLKQIEKLHPKGKLLDIGCAAGFFIDLARNQGWDVKGIDLSKEAIEFGKKKLKLDVKETILRKAGFKDGSFDVVTQFDVIEHLPDPKSEIKEMGRVLKKGGLLVLTTPNIGSLAAKILGKNWLELKRVREHIYFFSNKTLSKMLSDCGFNVVRIETTGRIFRLKNLLEMAVLQTKLVKPLLWLVKKTPLARLKVHINPMYKTTIYAVKNG